MRRTPVWATLYEQAYERVHGLRELPVGDRACLRFGVTRYRRRAVALPDGTLLARGDRVVVLHLHNAALALVRQDAVSVTEAGLTFRRLFRASLGVLAARLVADPDLGGVRAVGGLTYLWRGSLHFGFAAFPLRSPLWARIVAAHQQRLTRGHAAGATPGRAGRAAAGRGEARLIWISSAALVEKYGRQSPLAAAG